MRRTLIRAAIGLTMLLGLLPVPAAAVSPGTNGEIVTLLDDPATTGGFASIVAVAPDGTERELAEVNQIDTVAVSPDGTQIAYTLQRGLYRQPLAGTEDDRVRLASIGGRPGRWNGRPTAARCSCCPGSRSWRTASTVPSRATSGPTPSPTAA